MSYRAVVQALRPTTQREKSPSVTLPRMMDGQSSEYQGPPQGHNSARRSDRGPVRWRFLLAPVLAVLAGCASLPTDYPRSPSVAMQDHASTPIGRRVAEIAAQHPGNSAFRIIRYGRPAFTARVALADLAQETLDVQYFLWETDATGRNLVDRLVRAADRSVRVRILIDDFNLKDLDASIAALDAHPNIEVRLFNPFAHRDSRLAGFLTDFERVNHRMHNKLMVMDNAVAIVGGRNMSDPYFDVHPEFNFRDLDIAAAGPVVRDLSSVFDRFWNGPWSVPIAALVDRPHTDADLQGALKRLRENIAGQPYPHPLDEDVATLRSQLDDIAVGGIWARGQVVWDDPASINDPSLRTMRRLLVNRLERLERELLVEAAYFIPLGPGVDLLKGLASRGVRIRVLTNSLASNDVLAAFAGYSKVRGPLLVSGVELYEVRPHPGPFPQELVSFGSRAGLHTKAMVFDRKDVFVGSFNLDPRSSLINTEAGLYVESPELAEMVAQYMDEGVKPERSYRVLLDERGKMYWVTEDGGKPLRYDVDPLSTFWQRSNAGFIRLLPIESQL